MKDFEHLFSARSLDRLKDSFKETIVEALESDNVNEIMLNCDGKLFIEYKDLGIVYKNSLNDLEALSIIRTIASLLNIEIKESNPFLSTDIPFYGCRIEALLPPLVTAPVFSIRVLNKKHYSLDNLIAMNMLTEKESSFIKQCILDKKTILVSGQTSSGKTTLLNAILYELSLLCKKDRVISIEDTRELFIASENKVNLLSNNDIDMGQLLKSSLRLRPDRLIIGEIRGKEALYLLDALSTGHSGSFSTIHAGSEIQALDRLSLLVKRHEAAPDNFNLIIKNTIDVIIQLKKDVRRHISSISTLEDVKDNKFILKKVNF